MSQTSEIVRGFFESFEKASNALDLDLLGSLYSDAFLFASPQGAQPVKKDDFLKVLPKRKEFFKAIGLTSSKITALEEKLLDENYLMVEADWDMHFEKDQKQPIVDKISTTYILYQHENTLRIVFQLDHQDLSTRVQDLGLLPAKD